MSTQISKDEYKILKRFMKNPNIPISESEFDACYPKGSDIRISAIRLCREKLIRFIDSQSNDIEDTYKISETGRFAYKAYKECIKQKRKDFFADKIIDFFALVISLLALLKSFETEIANLITWSKQLLGL